MNKRKLSNTKNNLSFRTPLVIARSVATKLSTSETPHFGEAVVSGQSRIIANSVFPLSIFCLTFLAAFTAGSAFFSVGDSSAESTEVDIIARVHDVISITTDATDDELPLYVNPTPSGTLVKNQLTVMVSTNNSTGYTLNMNSITTNTSMVHESATGSPLSPNIPSTSHPYNTPAALTTDTWGWNLGTASSTSTFKKIPPSDDSQTIRTTDAPSSTPSPDSDTIVTFAVNITDAMAAGAYINTMVFTATTNYVPPVTPCKTGDYECILFTINTTDGTYSIPTSGRVASLDHTYDWDVYVDNVLTTDCPSGNCTGTSSTSTAPGVNGITLTGLSSGQHQIKIVPHNAPIPGWGNAFGHYSDTTGANAQANKNKIISLDSPLTTMAFAPKTSESTTNASYMFYGIFNYCTNLTAPANFMDTYKLPSTITDLSNFLQQSHSGNSNLSTPIDLAPLAGWFNANTSITNLSGFLRTIHYDNTNLSTPIDLSPLTNWFNSNNSITDLPHFLSSTHYGANTSLTTPIDLTPLAGWFNSNNSITNLSAFLRASYFSNHSLNTPTNLAPLAGWFNANTSITNLSEFLYSTHYNNDLLTTPINLAPLAGWFSNGRSFTNLDGYLYQTNCLNYNFTLSGQTIFPDWMKTMTEGGTPIWNVTNAFYRTFYLSSARTSDTGEPKFQDGTVLSSIGTPDTNRQTYTNRSGITPVNTNWK